jgi:N-methylhydantoinase A
MPRRARNRRQQSEIGMQAKATRYKVGIDTGGTFTDFLLMDGAGRTTVHKELSTPADPSIAAMAGLAELAAKCGLEPAALLQRIDAIVHGTTVTTNAVLTGNVARTGLLTTRGFRDALQMRRGVREVQYDNKYGAPEPIVPRHLRLPVSERIDHEGKVVAALDTADAEQAIAALRNEGVDAVAVCFMHAYANPEHEREVGEMLQRLMPAAYLSLSSRVLPQVRFYERTSTTVLNAAVGPILKRYLDALTAKLEEADYRGLLLIMQSNGGVASPAAVSALAAMTLLSGPAAAPAAGLACMGARSAGSDAGARARANKAGNDSAGHFITVDMGGTSFDAALVRDGAAAVTTSGSVARNALALPSMEINTIGAGGGSIAWLDEGGLLHMGPQSAGAAPGPACYGRGGVEPTCTDANLLLGYLSADFFAGGRIKLDAQAARRAVRERIAAPLGLSDVAAAAGMYHVINVNMASAIREISVQKGYDPREFPLICAGGAGPAHAAMIAAELGIDRVIIPRESAIFCAAGMLHTDFKHDFVRSHAVLMAENGADPLHVAALLDSMENEARSVLGAEGIPSSRQRLTHSVDLRYLGQYHEVNVALRGATLRKGDWAAVCEAFHARHDRLYGYQLRTENTPIEMLNLRLTALGLTDKPPPRRERAAGSGAAHALKHRRPVYLPEREAFETVPVYDGDRLANGNALRGPAVIESINTSLFVPSGYAARYDALGNCVLARGQGRGGKA